MAHRDDATRERLRSVGLRITKQRLAVLRWLGQHPHASADQIVAAVRAELGSVSTQAVYDVLHACVDGGLVRRIETAGHPAQFETRVQDRHHHLVCRGCGRTEDVDYTVGDTSCLEPTMEAGFVIDEAEVIFWGYCSVCQAQNDERHASA